VLAALTENKVYPDLYFGMNLRLIPGCSYPIGENFSELPMPEDSPFRASWWYRTQFRVPAGARAQETWLHFDGINFRANVWLNGQQIAKADEIAGTFRIHELNITRAVLSGQVNVLAVEVFPPEPDDLGWTFVDWNPTPPDKEMGIFRNVYLTTSGPVTLRYPQVVAHLDLPSLETAHLDITAEVRNATDHELAGILSGRIEEIRFAQTVKLGPHETKLVTFTSEEFRQLNFMHPRFWWPVQLGPQNLYLLEMQFKTGGRMSDWQKTRFGIREINSELDNQNHRLFTINGRKLLIRGGGWASDMFLRFDPDRLKTELQYVRDMNLNTIRLEGQLQPDYFFDLADEYGILIMAGWSCCSQWEHWEYRSDYQKGPIWNREDYEIAAKSQTDQIRRLRGHPSMLAWLNGSDNPPPADVEQMYVDILKRFQWPNPFLSSASKKASTVTGASGMKMEGPYQWVPPSYWLRDGDYGGAFGFATEISPGPAVPPTESLHRMLPKDHLWPIDEYWSYHCGGGRFRTLDVFTEALNARYGTAKGLEDYGEKSQLMAYEAQRAMFEAYGRNKYRSTGVIQWMLNNAWPSMIWHLYDYYLRPGGGYFGTKKACEPIHVQYSYDDRSIVVVNSTYKPISQIKVTAKVFDLNMIEKYSNDLEVSLPPDGVVRAFTLPDIKQLTPTYFLNLSLKDKDDEFISSNFYWLSTTEDRMDWANSKWYYTPTTSFADVTALQNLPPVKVMASGQVERERDNKMKAHVTVENVSSTLGFAVRLQIKRSRDAEEVLPILWEDNYFTLLPGEKRKLTALYSVKDLGRRDPMLVVSGWNVELKTQALVAKARRR
jgi:exo-1,4-beta-D-glucosaminidase